MAAATGWPFHQIIVPSNFKMEIKLVDGSSHEDSMQGIGRGRERTEGCRIRLPTLQKEVSFPRRKRKIKVAVVKV